MFVVVALLLPATLSAYEFPSDVEDTWPRPDEYFFLYVHTDHLRSSSLFTEGREKTTHNGIRFIKGEVVQRIEYTPFGKERYVLNPMLKQTPKYTDQLHDIEDGLYFYQSRYYDAVVGRFIQPDTWPAETSNSQTINAYAYVLNNPLKYVDPSGYVAELLDDDGYGNQVVVDLRGQFDQGEGTVTEREGRDSFSDTALDVVQVGFDVVGLIPGFGEPFDIASGLISFGRGDYLGASLSLVAAIPFVGIAGTVGKVTALQRYFPANNGFLGGTARKFLYSGERIDRYGGSAASRFFSPAGTPAAARALPPGTTSRSLRTFEVVKPFEVDAGIAAPAFGELGLGTQFRTPVPLDVLLRRGILREVTP